MKLINGHYEKLADCSFVFACFGCNFCVPGHPLMTVHFHLLFLLSSSFARYWSGKSPPPPCFFFFLLPPEHGNVGKCLVQDDAHWWESWSVFHPAKHCKWSVKTSLTQPAKSVSNTCCKQGNCLSKSKCMIQSKYKLRRIKPGQI